VPRSSASPLGRPLELPQDRGPVGRRQRHHLELALDALLDDERGGHRVGFRVRVQAAGEPCGVIGRDGDAGQVEHNTRVNVDDSSWI